MDSVITFAESETTWNVLCTDASGYASIALARAAGKKLWPVEALDPGTFAAHVVFACQTSADTATAGSGFFFAINRQDTGFASLASDAARDAVAFPVFTGQTWTYPGVSQISSVPVNEVWVRKTQSSDLLVVMAITG